MDENVKKFLREVSSPSMDKSLSDSSDTEEISKPTSIKLKKEIASEGSEKNVLTTSKPFSSMNRSREDKEKEEIQVPSKKMKKYTQGDEKSPKKRGYWTPEDEIAFLNGLLAFCKSGKLRDLPKIMSPFFQLVLKDLDGEYSRDQLYNKLLKLRAKYFGVRDNIKNQGFVGFKNAQEEAVYLLSKQVWGKGEEEDVGSVTMGKEGSVRVEEKKLVDVGEREELKRNKSGDVEMSVMEQDAEEDEEEEDGEEEEEEEEEEQGIYEQTDNLGKEVPHVYDSGCKGVTCMETEKSVENAGEEGDSSDESETVASDDENEGEEMYSSEDDVGEEQDSSEDDVGEEQDSSEEESEKSENELSGHEHSENLAGHVLNGAPRDNSRQNVAEEVSNDLDASGTTDMRNNGSNFVQNFFNDTANRTMGNFFPLHLRIIEGLSNPPIHFKRSSFASLLSLARQLPVLSDKEEEMLDQKWKEQQRFELEVGCKHIDLLLEEGELRMAKLRPMPGKALP